MKSLHRAKSYGIRIKISGSFHPVDPDMISSTTDLHELFNWSGRLLLAISFIVILTGCDSTTSMDKGPSVINDTTEVQPPPVVDPFNSDELIAFTVFFEVFSRVAVAPLSNISDATFITPDGGFFQEPVFSPDRSTIMIRDGIGPVTIYSLATGTLDTLIIQKPFSTAQFFVNRAPIVWPRNEKIVYYSSGFNAVRSFDLTTHEIAILQQEFWPIAAFESDSIIAIGNNVVRRLPREYPHVYIPSANSLHELPNPHLVIDGAGPNDVRFFRTMDWNSENKLFVVSATDLQSPASFRLLITNYSGTTFKQHARPSFHKVDARWGPGGLILYAETPDNLSQNDITFSLHAYDPATGEDRVLATKETFSSTFGVGAPDY